MASIAASSTFHSLSTAKSPNLSSTHLSKNLTFRTRPIENSRVCSFSAFTKQSRLGLRKLSCLGEGGGEGVAIADEEQQQQQQQQETVSVPVSPSDMLTMFFQADGTLNEAAIPNVTKALQDIDGVSNLKVQVSEGVAVVELSKQTTVQATGVASSLVETIQGAGFKLQTLNLSFEDEDEDYFLLFVPRKKTTDRPRRCYVRKKNRRRVENIEQEEFDDVEVAGNTVGVR